jgi:hypothetical protein
MGPLAGSRTAPFFMADEIIPTADDTSDPWAAWRGRISTSRTRREAKVGDWRENVTKRKGEGSDTTAAVSVNKDAPLTKAKIALLYSNTPEIRPTTEDPQAAQAVPQFARDLNIQIRKENVGAAIEEELADVVNAAGIGGVVIACEKRTVTKQVPSVDPMIAGMSGTAPEMLDVQTVADIRYPVRRISPTNLLIPAEFTGSVYDNARWLGYDDSMPWATAVIELGLTEDQKDDALGPDRKSRHQESLNTDSTATPRDADSINFTELFYWRHYYHEDETSFSALQRLVFVEGIEEPVINEPYAGQKRLEDGRVVGVVRNPIQILTLTYISDENLPPSDSTISRHQVSELERSRSQMELQRKHSNPINWFDTNRVSANTRSLLEKGTFQGFIPTNGPGDRAIGQVARTSFPQEKYELDNVIDREITDQWQVGANQIGNFASGERSAREAGNVERNFQTRIGQERSKVERHFIAISEVLGGLMALHGQSTIPVELLGGITFAIRADSTVLLSAEQRMAQLERQIDRLAQMPGADVQPLVAEWLELGGSDPTKILHPPQPKQPEPLNISLKGEDLMNPMALAFTYRTGQGPSPDDLSASIKAFQAALSAVVTGQVPAASLTPEPEGPPREGESLGIANADAQMAPRQDKRDQDTA